MTKKWNLAVAGILILLFIIGLIFKPQIERFSKDQYVLWQLGRLDVDRYQVTNTPKVIHVLLNKNEDRFVFFYTGVADISERVSVANKFLDNWPDNKSECEDKKEIVEVCLIPGSASILGN